VAEVDRAAAVPRGVRHVDIGRRTASAGRHAEDDVSNPSEKALRFTNSLPRRIQKLRDNEANGLREPNELIGILLPGRPTIGCLICRYIRTAARNQSILPH
jgi:hypothetical protein